MITLNKFWNKVNDFYQESSTDAPVNICLLNEDGTAVNFNIKQIYLFFTSNSDGAATANIVILPE